MDFLNICRICLKKYDKACEYVNINSKFRKLSYSLMISSLFSMPVSLGDGLPSKICKKCRTKLISAYNLKLLAQKSYNSLLNHNKNENIYLGDKDVIKEEEADRLEIKNENEAFGDSAIKQEYLEIKSNLSDSDKDTELCDGPKDDMSVDYDEEDNKPLKDLCIVSQKDQDVLENEKQKKLLKKKTGRKKILSVENNKNKSSKDMSGFCEICGKLVCKFTEHSQIHSENRKKYPCGDCTKVFNSEQARKQHQDVNHLGKLYFCEICKKSYKGKSNHILYKHSDRPLIFKCVMCNKGFPTKALLSQHASYHSGERSVACDLCGKMFRNNSAYSYHKRDVHDKEKSHACHFCPKAFFRLHHLKRHIRIHTNEKIYKCNQCEKAFTTSSGLIDHKRRHLGIKNYSCKICSKAFVNSGALGAHMVSHTKEKIHSCRFCNVKFGRPDNRNTHERTVHLNKHNTSMHKKYNKDSIVDE